MHAHRYLVKHRYYQYLSTGILTLYYQNLYTSIFTHVFKIKTCTLVFIYKQVLSIHFHKYFYTCIYYQCLYTGIYLHTSIINTCTQVLFLHMYLTSRLAHRFLFTNKYYQYIFTSHAHFINTCIINYE